ncbi:hypothetical protein [Halomarina oriensis]|uniref:DUF5667 domain-containing protein n=1 Tax=Halomarina oriensis TaxID=671145 RepID=A0A6B0GJR3_9EURY|nr:hypothetical protein [Halomarina oriensis]MWG35082.1 hypothetical protein [Halomarina oriensis]
MNRQVVSVVAVLALVVLAAPTGGVAPPAAGPSDDSTLGSEVSSFMQVSAVEAESELDRGMFSAKLANAPNDTVRQRLVERRADRLSKRLDTVERSVEAAENGGVVDRTVADALVDALERSVADVDALATRIGVSLPGLDGLRETARGLGEPSVPSVLDAGDEVELDPSGDGSESDGEDGGVPADPNENDGGGDDGAAGQDGADGDGDGGVSVDGGDTPESGTSGVNAGQDGDSEGPSLQQNSNTTTTDSPESVPFDAGLSA